MSEWIVKRIKKEEVRADTGEKTTRQMALLVDEDGNKMVRTNEDGRDFDFKPGDILREGLAPATKAKTK